MIETFSAIPLEELLVLPEVIQLIRPHQSVVEKIQDWKIHLLTHQRINYRILTMRLLQANEMPDEFIKVNKKDIFNFAVPKLLETHMKANLEDVRHPELVSGSAQMTGDRETSSG